jgi:hypothetical protein
MHEDPGYLVNSPHNKVISANVNLMYELLVVIIVKLFMLSFRCKGIRNIQMIIYKMYDKGHKLKRTEINLKTLLYFISRFKSLYYIYDYHIKILTK